MASQTWRVSKAFLRYAWVRVALSNMTARFGLSFCPSSLRNFSWPLMLCSSSQPAAGSVRYNTQWMLEKLSYWLPWLHLLTNYCNTILRIHKNFNLIVRNSLHSDALPNIYLPRFAWFFPGIFLEFLYVSSFSHFQVVNIFLWSCLWLGLMSVCASPASFWPLDCPIEVSVGKQINNVTNTMKLKMSWNWNNQSNSAEISYIASGIAGLSQKRVFCNNSLHLFIVLTFWGIPKTEEILAIKKSYLFSEIAFYCKHAA